jgi:hypothetical protein
MIGIGNLDMGYLDSPSRAIFSTTGRGPSPLATLAVVCRGPRRKSSLPKARLRAQTLNFDRTGVLIPMVKRRTALQGWNPTRLAGYNACRMAVVRAGT